MNRKYSLFFCSLVFFLTTVSCAQDSNQALLHLPDGNYNIVLVGDLSSVNSSAFVKKFPEELREMIAQQLGSGVEKYLNKEFIESSQFGFAVSFSFHGYNENNTPHNIAYLKGKLDPERMKSALSTGFSDNDFKMVDDGFYTWKKYGSYDEGCLVTSDGILIGDRKDVLAAKDGKTKITDSDNFKKYGYLLDTNSTFSAVTWDIMENFGKYLETLPKSDPSYEMRFMEAISMTVDFSDSFHASFKMVFDTEVHATDSFIKIKEQLESNKKRMKLVSSSPISDAILSLFDPIEVKKEGTTVEMFINIHKDSEALTNALKQFQEYQNMFSGVGSSEESNDAEEKN